jgi:radical SAM superfamily enzyme YgiQ (UPF0313 family)
MWGYEGEELEDIEATVRHVSKSNPDVFLTTVSYPIKGTPYYKKISDRLVQLEPWSTTSDRELKIKGRHSRKFYAQADKLLRSEVERARILRGESASDSSILTSIEQNVLDARAGMQASYAEVEQ